MTNEEYAEYLKARRRLYYREYYKRNREKILAQRAAWLKKHPGYQKEWLKRHPGYMAKYW